MLLCFVIPAHNEGRSIGHVVSQLRNLYPSACTVVVNDGSRDCTHDAAVAAGATVIDLPFNLGYGGALHTGLLWAWRNGADRVVTLDADGQHDPREIAKLLPPVEADEVDLVLGSRYLPGSSCYRVPAARRLGALFFSALVSRLTGTRITDPTTGFQCFNRAVLESYAHLPAFPEKSPDADLLLYAHYRRFRIREVAVTMHADQGPDSMHGGLKSLFYVPQMLTSMLGIFLAHIPFRKLVQP